MSYSETKRIISMKRIKICMNICAAFFAVLLSGADAYSQDYRYTPFGTIVPVIESIEELSPYCKAALREYYTEHFPHAIYLGEATSIYNCHGYAWVMSDGGYPCNVEEHSKNLFITDGSYVETTSSDVKATKVSYVGGDHSAVVPFSGNPYVVSKWGVACLMRHSPTDCPYHDYSRIAYYKLSMEIMGEEIIQLPGISSSVTKTYSLSSVPSGAVVNWRVANGMSILSGQGTSTVDVEIPGVGNYFVGATVINESGLEVPIPFNLNITASVAPIITDIELFQYCQEPGEYTMKVVSTEAGAVLTWSTSSSNAQLYDIPYPDDATFADAPNMYKAVRFLTPGTYTITVSSSALNGANFYSYSKTFTIMDYYSGSLL